MRIPSSEGQEADGEQLSTAVEVQAGMKPRCEIFRDLLHAPWGQMDLQMGTSRQGWGWWCRDVGTRGIHLPGDLSLGTVYGDCCRVGCCFLDLFLCPV